MLVFKTLSAKAAAALDAELMSTGSFSIDQLMELAGLAVAKAVYKQYPPKRAAKPETVLVLVGPGNNGGDGLVCARHLKAWNYCEPVVFYPKRPQKDLYVRLTKQLEDMGVRSVNDVDLVKKLLEAGSTKVIIDALFGFSFRPPLRAPFDELVGYLSANSAKLAPIVSVDIPSGWDVDEGPLDLDINAAMLVSLTAPKPCAEKFQAADKAHYLGGRFINDAIAEKYGIADLLKMYHADDLVVKL
ncbi:YjeF N-terminal domain-like protein [Metschnikowia bicuspidata var. bicuspidata NRRL YB-4993]|uniref:NAD(P)H-hydrate epimerase n=1 Tax=Metschnikowia bicuspidata var. bicuspidata NRRL YB-4993 TaxID=869754 RepID=A0A1A0H8C1_9ASCO|nr:YjeF N-terminal domain-like protein [Metschnikowia bicuspidata var. bicuspidata NRRL YB-4993]OBA20359.1 YjeF N-terminal domain-like protein [Metschnikowia bicuspidata var. bicuspidata NRRL YB-4993]